MKIAHLILLFIFSSVLYSQEYVKLQNKTEILQGKVLFIRSSTVEFEQSSTGFKFEFNKSEIDFIVSEKGDTLWFKSGIESTNDDINLSNQSSINSEFKRLTFFFCYNFSGDHDVSLGTLSGNLDVNPQIALGFEFDAFKTYNDIFKFGFGVIFQLPRKQIGVDGKFYFIPLYAFTKLTFVNEGKTRAYAVPTIGYNFYKGDTDYTGGLNLDGGFYNSFGLGLLFNNKMDLKLVYQFNRGSVVIEQIEDAKIVYTSFGIHFGYYF